MKALVIVTRLGYLVALGAWLDTFRVDILLPYGV